MSDNLTTWEHNGQSFELDIQDADTAERFEAANAFLIEECANIPQENVADAVRGSYEAYVKTFDKLFGDGAGKRIIGEKANSRLAMEAWISLMDFMQKQVEHLNAMATKIKKGGTRA